MCGAPEPRIRALASHWYILYPMWGILWLFIKSTLQYNNLEDSRIQAGLFSSEVSMNESGAWLKNDQTVPND